MTRRRQLWNWALKAYARPGVEAACMALQDEHGPQPPAPHQLVVTVWPLWQRYSV